MNTNGPSKPRTSDHDAIHLLRIYLRDHEAASVGGLQLFRRCCKANQGTQYFAELQRLTAEVRSDRDALRDICRQFEVKFASVGRALAFASATLGRVKTNGRALTYSPLSRVIELAALSSGLMAKLRLWESLLLLCKAEPRLDETEMDRHAADANKQLLAIRGLHQLAVAEAFA
jgi:hypothetical protein